MKKLLLSMILGALVLTGCGGSKGADAGKAVTYECVTTEDEMDMTISMSGKNDKLEKLSMLISTDLGEEMTGEVAELTKSIFEEMFLKFDGFSGEVDIDGSMAAINIEIDINKVTPDSGMFDEDTIKAFKQGKITDIVKEAEKDGASCTQK